MDWNGDGKHTLEDDMIGLALYENYRNNGGGNGCGCGGCLGCVMSIVILMLSALLIIFL